MKLSTNAITMVSIGLGILCGRTAGFPLTSNNQINWLLINGRAAYSLSNVHMPSSVPDSDIGDKMKKRKRKVVQAPAVAMTDPVAAKNNQVRGTRAKSTGIPSPLDACSSEHTDVENEIILSRRIKVESALQECYKLLEQKLERPPSQEEWCDAAGLATTRELMDLVESGRQAKAQIVSNNIGLVHYVVRKYVRSAPSQVQFHGSRVETVDIIQEGTLGLIRAAEKFDPEKGIRFSTLATIWIRHFVGRFMKRSRLVHVPVHIQDLGKKMQSAETVMPDGESMELNELAEVFNVSTTKARSARLSYSSRVISFDANEDDTRSLIEEYSAETDESMDMRITSSEIEAVLTDILSSQEIAVLRLRFGLDGEASKSYREIAKILGIGREMSRRICKRSFEKIRNTDTARALRDSCFGEFCDVR